MLGKDLIEVFDFDPFKKRISFQNVKENPHNIMMIFAYNRMTDWYAADNKFNIIEDAYDFYERRNELELPTIEELRWIFKNLNINLGIYSRNSWSSVWSKEDGKEYYMKKVFKPYNDYNESDVSEEGVFTATHVIYIKRTNSDED